MPVYEEANPCTCEPACRVVKSKSVDPAVRNFCASAFACSPVALLRPWQKWKRCLVINSLSLIARLYTDVCPPMADLVYISSAPNWESKSAQQCSYHHALLLLVSGHAKMRSTKYIPNFFLSLLTSNIFTKVWSTFVSAEEPENFESSWTRAEELHKFGSDRHGWGLQLWEA